MKELYDVSLKTTYPIELDGRRVEVGETIAIFDKIQLATLAEKSTTYSANGGYDNRALVWWEETKEIALRFTQGVFSKKLFALMSNSALIKNAENQPIPINIRENIETDERGVAVTRHQIDMPAFVYDAKTGEKIANASING
jgi:hypothetical protein